MARYYVNKNAQANGDHEVHEFKCRWLPDNDNRKYLGDFENCHHAVREAKIHYDKVNGCFYCSRSCHTS